MPDCTVRISRGAVSVNGGLVGSGTGTAAGQIEGKKRRITFVSHTHNFTKQLKIQPPPGVLREDQEQ